VVVSELGVFIKLGILEPGACPHLPLLFEQLGPLEIRGIDIAVPQLDATSVHALSIEFPQIDTFQRRVSQGYSGHLLSPHITILKLCTIEKRANAGRVNPCNANHAGTIE
jgi:hypothetical protein